MTVTFTTDDQQEIKRLAKANDMAIFIWELVHNRIGLMKIPDKYKIVVDNSIYELLDENNIIIDDLTQ